MDETYPTLLKKLIGNIHTHTHTFTNVISNNNNGVNLIPYGSMFTVSKGQTVISSMIV